MNAEQLTEQIGRAARSSVEQTIARINQGRHDLKIHRALVLLASLEFSEAEDRLREWANDFDDPNDAAEAFALAELVSRARSVRLGVMADPGCRRCMGHGEVREAEDAPGQDCPCVGAR